METPSKELALKRLFLSYYFRKWTQQSLLETQKSIQSLYQIFTTPHLSFKTSFSPVITRRPALEELKQSFLTFPIAHIPRSCTFLRGQIWQILLNVYKRNSHSMHAKEFDRILYRLRKLPREELLTQECHCIAKSIAKYLSKESECESIRLNLETLLLYYLSTKSIWYQSGMAHLMGVFFLVSLPLPVMYDCYYQFCAQFLSDVWACGSDEGLNRQSVSKKELLEQLLGYHDPELAHFLDQWCWNEWSEPDQLIPAEFFGKSLFRRMEPHCFVHVLDQYLLTNDSLFGLFLLLAILTQYRTELMHCASIKKSDVETSVADSLRSEIVKVVQNAIGDEENVQFLCLLAARIKKNTPKSYCNERSEQEKLSNTSYPISDQRASESRAAKESISSSNARELASIDVAPKSGKEPKSLTDKLFWYNIIAGSSQSEMISSSIPQIPRLFTLSITADEVCQSVFGCCPSNASGLRFFIVDCRALRSSEDMDCGRVPSAYTLDPSTFDSPELIGKTLEAMEPLRSRVHIVLLGYGVAVHHDLIKTEEIRAELRSRVQEDANHLNQAALFFQKRGYRYVSMLDGGFAAWHTFMRSHPTISLQELVGHVSDRCHNCRYDEWALSGTDPFVKRFARLSLKRNRSMPTTSTLPVTDLDQIQEAPLPDSIFSASNLIHRASVSVSRSSITSMKSRITDVSKLPWAKLSRKSGLRWKRSECVSANRWSMTSEEYNGDERDSIQTNLSADDILMPNRHSLNSSKPASDIFTIEYSDDEELIVQRSHDTRSGRSETSKSSSIAAAFAKLTTQSA